MYKHFRPNKYVYIYICLHNIITQQKKQDTQTKNTKKSFDTFLSLCIRERERFFVFCVHNCIPYYIHFKQSKELRSLYMAIGCCAYKAKLYALTVLSFCFPPCLRAFLKCVKQTNFTHSYNKHENILTV